MKARERVWREIINPGKKLENCFTLKRNYILRKYIPISEGMETLLKKSKIHKINL